MKMYENILTVGLFDKDTERQEVEMETAKDFISKKLINDFNVYAFTMIECYGVYKMNSTGAIVKEPSIRIEIAAENEIDFKTVERIIYTLKTGLNQESIMHKTVISEIDFI